MNNLEDLSFIESYKGVLFYRHNRLSYDGVDCVYLRGVERGKMWAGYTYISRLVMKDSNINWRDIAIEMVLDDARENEHAS